MLSLALIWPPAPGIPPAPSLEGSFSRLPADCGNNFLSFSILGQRLGGGEGRRGQQQPENHLLSAPCMVGAQLTAWSQGNPPCTWATLWLYKQGTIGEGLLLISQVSFTLLCVPGGGFLFFPKPERQGRGCPHLLGPPRQPPATVGRNPPQHHYSSLGLRAFIWDTGTTSNSAAPWSHPGKLERGSLGSLDLHLDPSSHFIPEMSKWDSQGGGHFSPRSFS